MIWMLFARQNKIVIDILISLSEVNASISKNVELFLIHKDFR